MAIKPISKIRFDALCYCREPIVDLVCREVEWYADTKELVLGAVQFQFEDSDWSWIVLGRDGNGVFRAIDGQTTIASEREARAQLRKKLLHHSKNSDGAFIQGDERKKSTRLFERIVGADRLHPLFKLICEGPHHSSARGIMQEIANAFVDVDGNYVKDFQTTGFNARLWELFLFAFLHEQRFAFLREFKSPDYCVTKGGFPVAIEAVTVNPSSGETLPAHRTVEERRSLCENYLPIKFGSALFVSAGLKMG